MGNTIFKKQEEEEGPTNVTDGWPEEGKQQSKRGESFKKKNTYPPTCLTPLKKPMVYCMNSE